MMTLSFLTRSLSLSSSSDMESKLFLALDVLVQLAFGADHQSQFTGGVVSSRCLQCICDVESGCAQKGCAWDVNSNSCGFFQLKEVYWVDCGKPGSSLAECANDIHCASRCVQHYMSRYIGYSGCAHNCESYARIHNGGPRGCQHSNTLDYWRHIQHAGCSAHS